MVNKQVNPRISTEVYDRILVDAQSNDLSVNVMASHVLEKYYELTAIKMERGDISISRNVFKNIIADKTNQKEFEERARMSALEVLAEMRIQKTKIDLNELHRRIIEWHEYNDFKINFFDGDGERKYVIKHELGEKWSEFECIMYGEIFKRIGETVINSEHDTISYTLEIAKHQTD